MSDQTRSSRNEGGDGRPLRDGVRYTRRRWLVVGGLAAAGIAGAAVGLTKLKDPALESVGGALSDQFGSFPVRSIENVPDVPPEEWTITVDGLVEKPLQIDRATWSSLQRFTETVDFHCVEGWSVGDVTWGGVTPGVLLDLAGVKPEASWVVFHAYGGDYESSVPMELVTDPQTVLADSMHDEPLPAKHGGPVRLIVPEQLAYKSVKWVTRLEITDASRAGYWESRGYPNDAPITGAVPGSGEAGTRSG